MPLVHGLGESRGSIMKRVYYGREDLDSYDFYCLENVVTGKAMPDIFAGWYLKATDYWEWHNYVAFKPEERHHAHT